MEVDEIRTETYHLAAAVILIVAASVSAAIKLRTQKQKIWPRKWLLRRRFKSNVLSMLNKELLHEDPQTYKKILRMPNDLFESLLNAIKADIRKVDTFMRVSIPPRTRLEITLRFLATGESFRSLMYSTRVHESTISRFVPEVSQAIINALKSKYMKFPSTASDWKSIAEKFYELWDFPNCAGALDGKHISFRAPQSAGSYYYNYKGFHSVILLALVDAEYKFLYTHVGTNGRVSDGGVLRESNLLQVIDTDPNFPVPEPLPGGNKNVPFVIVADDAFPLSSHIIKPYSQRNLTREKRIFNYRLSRARRIVENSFGILANRFRVLLTTMNLSPDKVDLITYCCVVLHNFLLENNKESYVDNLNSNCNSKTLSKARLPRTNRSSVEAKGIREEFKNFFNGPVGYRYWQDDQIEKSNL